ncbi:MAG: MFS transporter, partial [Acidimicrobiales bacterium]
IFGVPFILLAPLGGRLAERRGPLIAGAIGLVLSDGFMAAYGFVRSPHLILALGVGEACVAAVATPAGFAAVNRVFPEQRIATGQGIFGGSGTIAAGASAMIGAPVYAALGAGAAFAGGASASALLVVVAVVLDVWRRDRTAADPAGVTPCARPATSGALRREPSSRCRP